MFLKKKINNIIRSSYLKKIRENLRDLISKDIFENPERDTKILHEQIRELEQKIQKNEQFLYESIVVCPVCFATNRDMTYNPVRKTWYCTECYEVLKKGNAERGTPEEFP